MNSFNGLVEFVQQGNPIVYSIDENTQFEIQTVVVKSHKYGLGRRILKGQRIGFGGLDQ